MENLHFKWENHLQIHVDPLDSCLRQQSLTLEK